MKKIIVSSLLVLCGVAGMAQNVNDALRYSSISYNGTARFMGLSGAYGAVGADFSSLSQNPAGIALYRKSEFTVTPGIYSANTESMFYAGKNSENRTAMTFQNLGMVFGMNLNDNDKGRLIKGLQFGFGMNRLNNFADRITISGFNNSSSLLTTYMNDANSSGLLPADLGTNDFGYQKFSTLLAYKTDLLFYDTTTKSYGVDMPGGKVLQTKTIESLGSSREMLISGGANFGDKFYLGASMSFPSIRYEEQSQYSEKDVQNLNSYFDSFTRNEYLTTKGNGFNFKFGFIFKPVDFIRIGAAFHTPTTYNLTDTYSAKMTSTFDQATGSSATSPDGAYDYKLTTPMRVLGSLAVIIGNLGLISADYEYVDYSTSRLRADNYNFFDENNTIRNTLSFANNFRFGTEWKYGVFAFRAGTSFYGSPYKNETARGARMAYSGGIGIHEQNYSLDFAFNHQLSKDDYYLYDSSLIPAAKNTSRSNQFQMTLGMRF